MSALGTVSPKLGLRRDLGLVDAVGIGLGAIVGAGLFVVTGVAAGVAGPAFVVSLALAAVPAACNALSSAELAARFPQAGGTYEYGCRVLHPWAGFAAGWLFLASKLAAGGTVALGFGAYLAEWIPAIGVKYEFGVDGMAVLLITHEHDIAEYGTRAIACRDGQIVSDRAVSERRHAEAELQALPQPETAA